MKRTNISGLHRQGDSVSKHVFKRCKASKVFQPKIIEIYVNINTSQRSRVVCAFKSTLNTVYKKIITVSLIFQCNHCPSKQLAIRVFLPEDSQNQAWERDYVDTMTLEATQLGRIHLNNILCCNFIDCTLNLHQNTLASISNTPNKGY